MQHVAQTAFGQFVQASACAACGGRGVRIDSPCSDCRGRGRLTVRRGVEVQVPPGIASGQRLRLAGRGHEGEGGAGDLYVQVAVASDPRFERDGNDLVTVLDLPFTRAALGATVAVETLEGSEEIEVKPGTQPGEVSCCGAAGSPCSAAAAAATTASWSA